MQFNFDDRSQWIKSSPCLDICLRHASSLPPILGSLHPLWANLLYDVVSFSAKIIHGNGDFGGGIIGTYSCALSMWPVHRQMEMEIFRHRYIIFSSKWTAKRLSASESINIYLRIAIVFELWMTNAWAGWRFFVALVWRKDAFWRWWSFVACKQ